MRGIGGICAIFAVGLMLGSIGVFLTPNVSAGHIHATGPVMVKNYDHLYVYTTSDGYEDYEYIYGKGTASFAHDVVTNRAMVVTNSGSPGQARAHATVYQEFNFAAGMFGYVTFTVTGYYSGRVSLTGMPGFADLWYYLRVLDLNNHFPNDIISESMVRHLSRSIYGSQTEENIPCSATFSYLLQGSCPRLGIAAQIVSATEGYDPLQNSAEANAFSDIGKTWGMWISSIEVQAPSPGPGCVAEGTLVTMADGTSMPVEEIQPGNQVLGYDVATQSYVTETVQTVTSAKSPAILNINDGALRVTPEDQPIYVKNATGVGWVTNPLELRIGWQILEVKNGSWVTIASLEFDHHKTKVYDFQTDGPMTYLANGYLVLDKPHR